jgi:FKBP-type peptidyl-prolyl cis-trans isomerase
MILGAILLPLVASQAPSPAPSPKLQIKDLVVGAGPVAQDGDMVTVDYTGKLTSGAVFDSTKGREPFTFMVGAGEVIKGWDQGVAGMRVGGSRDLIIPAALAYGDRAVGPIPAKSDLLFSISLLRIEPKVATTVEVKGTGNAAKYGDLLTVQLVGGIQGGKADVWNTREEGDRSPIKFSLGTPQLPKGLIPGLLGMQAGEKRKIVIPPALAYGPKGVPPVDTKNPRDGSIVKAGSIIPPNSTMVFEVELVQLDPRPKPPETKQGVDKGKANG